MRISFLGGSSDYPAWFHDHPGAVLSTTIDKYSYITVREILPVFDHRYEVSYSTIEHVRRIQDIRHPSARECLKFMGVDQYLTIKHDGDLPARTGLGSSSAYTVGLLKCLHALQNQNDFNNRHIADEAIHVEQDLIGETVGCQDQLACAIGGLNYMEFLGNTKKVWPVKVSHPMLEALEGHLMLLFTGFVHNAPEIAADIVTNMNKHQGEFKALADLASEGRNYLEDWCVADGRILDFGRLLGESWQIKKRTSEAISTQYIDWLYDQALKAGAVGGKVLGAGGGGFLLLLAEPDKQPAIQKELKLLRVPFHFENQGCQIIYQDGAGWCLTITMSCA